jgi:cysteine synthase B
MPTIFDRSRVDRVENVSQAASETMARRLAASKAFCQDLVGRRLRSRDAHRAQAENATIVFIVCDRGDRYLSTGVFPA